MRSSHQSFYLGHKNVFTKYCGKTSAKRHGCKKCIFHKQRMGQFQDVNKKKSNHLTSICLLMMISCLRQTVLSGLKYELIKIRKPVSLSTINPTSFQSATSDFKNKHSTSSDQLPSDKLTMMLPEIYNHDLYYSRPNICKGPTTIHHHTFSPVRHYSSLTKIQSHNYKGFHMSRFDDDYKDNKESLLQNRAAAIFRNYKRTFLRPSLDGRTLGSVSLLDIKKFLRQKMVEFKESHACLCLR